jgi:hypothetical protein
MTETKQIDPFVQYVYDFQSKEQALQAALEGLRIKFGEQELTLEAALSVLAETYGTSNVQARARTTVCLNLISMLDNVRKLMYMTNEQRNEMIQKAAELAKPKEEGGETEEQREERILAEARAIQRKREKLEVPAQ